jgi:hypothetical protein
VLLCCFRFKHGSAVWSILASMRNVMAAAGSLMISRCCCCPWPRYTLFSLKCTHVYIEPGLAHAESWAPREWHTHATGQIFQADQAPQSFHAHKCAVVITEVAVSRIPTCSHQ